jgi:hypothetical protein
MTVPISVFALIRHLDPEVIVLDQLLGPSTTTLSTQLALMSNGFWSYRGSIHESGLVGHNYSCTFALDVRDPLGKTIVFEHHGTIRGLVIPGDSDDSWQQDGHSPFIADTWDTVKLATGTAHLHVSTEPMDAFLVTSAGAVALAVGAFVALTMSGSDVKCHWSNEIGGPRCEWGRPRPDEGRP